MAVSTRMITIELACLAIVALYLAAALARVEDRAVYLRRFVLLVAASWIAEDSCIRLYGFYSYHAGWWPFVDQVPLPIVIIWPVVILSAGELAGCLLRPGPLSTSLAGGATVLSDAALIEPVAVRAGLWTWSEPGFFGVPIIGVLGWGLFAAVCLALFARGQRRGAPTLVDELPVLLGAPPGVHAALVALWWAGLRWLTLPLPGWPAAALAWGCSLALVVLALRSRARRRVPLAALLTRVPAAGFFFVLLALHGRGDRALVAYALAFAPPYLALIDYRRLIRR